MIPKLLEKVWRGVENFCLCRLDPHYVNKPSWSQGFSVVYRKKGSTRFHLYPIAFVGYKFFFGDKEYSLSGTYCNRRRARGRTPALS